MIETPYPFQLVGAEWLATKKHAFLADDMGLGKSCQAIRAADILGLEDILVICPANCCPNWIREFKRFSPMDRPITVIESGKDPIPAHGGVVIISYDLAVVLATELKTKIWDAVILDEAHYLKERTAKRTRAIYGRGAKTPGIILNAQHVWRLSGTPAPNDAGELWAHLYFGDIKVDNHWDFVFHFCTGFDSTYGFKISGHKNTEELKALIKPFMLRRTKAQVAPELPALRIQEVIVDATPLNLDPAEQAVITEEERTLRIALASLHGGDPTQTLGSLNQSLATLRRYTAMQKLPAILDILEDELRRDRKLKLVLFGVHRVIVEDALARLAPFGAVSLYGATPNKQRQKNINSFIDDPNCRVFIGNIDAAGTGIDGLQKASCEVCFLEQTWVPATNAQAIMRVHRNLQLHPVRVRVFMLPESTDQQVQAALVRKVKELAKII